MDNGKPQFHKTDAKFDVMANTVTFTPKEANGIAIVNASPSIVSCDTILELAAMIILGRKQAMQQMAVQAALPPKSRLAP